jgi:ABC-type antimicrobial peptide transport system permease subunit
MRFIHKDEYVYHPQLFLHPMSKWHLFSEFKDGVHAGGRIQYVWMFGIIGVFVLLLACINFMNLSTARSEKRAKEVGIRKAIGSLRGQLIRQFFSESLLVSLLAFMLALVLVEISLPFFNRVADKQMTLLWQSPLFWLLGLSFCIVTGLIAGSYPALYLSSFKPVQVLKGSWKAGPLAAILRRVLVVLQFTVSVVLIIGTIVVFRQIQFAKDRNAGYSRDGLVMLPMLTREIHDHFDAVKADLLAKGAIAEMAETNSPMTQYTSTNGGFDWKGKDPGLSVDFPRTNISFDLSKTVGWQFVKGRGFSRDFPTDSAAFVINETAARYMGMKEPVGETLRLDGRPYTIIGVVKDMIVESPYEPSRPAVYDLSKDRLDNVMVRLNPAVRAATALGNIEKIFLKYNPSQPFDYQFVDTEYARKFGDEERVGKLASILAVLAVFISCLGLFALASFMAEQRTKEIGIRKVLGATVLNVWSLLSREFLLLVTLSLLIAIPLAWCGMHQWLQNFTYRTGLSLWIFLVASLGGLVITLLTVSWQAIRAATANPVKSLRSE